MRRSASTRSTWWPNRTKRAAIDRYYTDTSGKRVSGYYVIVKAHDDRGRLLTRRIHNNESDQYEKVKRWGERVPAEVYEPSSTTSRKTVS